MTTINVTINGNYAFIVSGNETTQVVISEYINGGAQHLTTEQKQALDKELNGFFFGVGTIARG